MRHLLKSIVLIVGITALASPALAKVQKFEITRVESPAFEGRTFGAVGTYDRITARATIAVFPDDPHNTVIVDLDGAPHNPRGVARAVADVEILRPTIAANGNRRLFYEVVNRGGKLGLALFNDLPTVVNDPVKASDAGNGFLMNRGYTIVWSGWQGDIVPGDGRMTFSPPIVPDVTGPGTRGFIFDHSQNPASATLSYPAADLDPAHAGISVRQREADERATPAGLEFKFESPTKISIKRPEGFDAGAIYEFIYTAKDPKVMGLGFAATRDIVSFLRYENADTTGTANPLAGRIDRAIGFGLSQSGRYLHDYLYLGFNADEAGRIGIRGVDAAHLRRQEDVHELSLQPARPLAVSARRHALSRRGFSLHLSRHHRCLDRKNRRLSGALPCRRQLPEDHQDRQRDRVLSAARVAGGDRYQGQRALHAG